MSGDSEHFHPSSNPTRVLAQVKQTLFQTASHPQMASSVQLAVSPPAKGSSSRIPEWLIGTYYHLSPSIHDPKAVWPSSSDQQEEFWTGGVYHEEAPNHCQSSAKSSFGQHWFDAIPTLHRIEFGAGGEEEEKTGESSFKNLVTSSPPIYYNSRLVGAAVLEEWRGAIGGIPVGVPVAQVLYGRPRISLADRVNGGVARLGDRLKRTLLFQGKSKRIPAPSMAVLGTSVTADFPMGPYHGGSEGRLVVHQEGLELALQMDTVTLAPRSLFAYQQLNPQFRGKATPQPRFDPTSGEMIQILMEYPYSKSSKLARYRVISIPSEAAEAASSPYEIQDEQSNATGTLIAAFLASPTLLRSFAITPNYVVVAIFPLYATPVPSRFKGSLQWNLQRHLHFHSEEDTLFYIISRIKGHLVAVYRSEAAFAFHAVNAYESSDGNTVFFDAATYEDAQIIRYLSAVDSTSSQSMPYQLPSNNLRRYVLRQLTEEAARFDGAAGQLPFFPLATYHQLTDFGLELPVVASSAIGQPYRHVYGVALHRRDRGRPGMIWNAVVKVDLKSPSRSFEWWEEGCIPSHPVLINPRKEQSSKTGLSSAFGLTPPPSTQASRRCSLPSYHESEFDEDDGVLLVSVYNLLLGRSFMVILDAHDLHELGRLNLPCVVLPSFSLGCWSWAPQVLLGELHLLKQQAASSKEKELSQSY